MAKQPLKEIDYQVERGLRWAWWAMAYRYMAHNKMQDANVISVDHHNVLPILKSAFPEKWGYGDEQKVAYRLRKLAAAGRITKRGSRYCSYTPGVAVDPYIATMVEAQRKQEEIEQEQQRQTLKWVKATMDKVVPGHDMEVARTYARRGVAGMSISMAGPASSFKMLLRLAEMQVEAQDAEADRYE